MANNITQLKIGTTTYDINDNRIITLTDNSTATAGTWLAKTSQISAYADGQIFLYKIAKAGGSSTTTLNITGSAGTALGAKTIYRSGTSKLTTHYGVGQYLLLSYNSTNDCFRVVNDYDANSNTDAIYSGIGICSTAAATAAKVVTLPKFALATSATILIRVSNTNSATSGVTLNVNSTGAKSIYIGGSAWSTSNQLYAGDYVATYDGTYWKLTRIYLTDTTYGVATSSTAGLVKSSTTGTTSGRDYAVQVNSDGTMKVNVPWTNVNSGYSSSSHKHDYSGTTDTNGGTAVAAVTAINAGSGSLTNTESSGIQYVESISGSAPSLGGTKTFVTGYSSFSGGGATEKYLHHSHTAASLGTASTSSAAPGKHTHSYTTYSLSGSNCSHSTRKMSFSAGTTPVASITISNGEGRNNVLIGSFSEGVLDIWSVPHEHSATITRGTAPSMNFNASSGNTYVYSVTNSNLSLSTSSSNTGENSGTNFNAVTGYPNFSGGSGSLTSNDTASGGIKYLSAHTAASLGTASTGTVSISGGSYSATKKYLTHTHTGASVKSTANAAPHTHTHGYSGTTGAPK